MTFAAPVAAHSTVILGLDRGSRVLRGDQHGNGRHAWQRGVLDSYDKQYVRNWLLHESGWDRHGSEAPPALPDEVVAATRERYLQAYERLTGSPFTA